MRLLFVGLAVAALSACANLPAPFNTSPFDSGAPAASAAAADSSGAPVAVPLTRQQQELADAERRLFAQGQEQGLGTAMAASMDQSDGFVVRSGAVLTPATVASELNTSTGPIFAQPDRVYVSNDGSMGMTSGRYVQVRTGAEALQGRYTLVWRKDVAGQWRVLSESRIPDPLRATAPSSTTPPATLTTRR